MNKYHLFNMQVTNTRFPITMLDHILVPVQLNNIKIKDLKSLYKKSFALQANRTILQNIDVGHDRNLKDVQNGNTLNFPFTVCSRQKKSKRRESLNFARNTRLYQDSGVMLAAYT